VAAEDTLTVGLRFERNDATLLRALAERGKSEGLHVDKIGLFEKAAADAAVGEPLLVSCATIEEAYILADGFTLYGITRPTIEHLSG